MNDLVCFVIGGTMVYQIGGHEMPEFKVGDRVYCPIEGFGVYAVFGIGAAALYPLSVCGMTVTEDGRSVRSAVHPIIFHATPENQSKLEALYGVKFDDAPKPTPVGSDLTRWLLVKHGKPVLCYISDRSDGDAVDGAIRKISGVTDGGNSFVTTGGTVWYYAVPINITELSTAADYVAD